MTYRKTYLDPDYRNESGKPHSCCRCGKEINGDNFRWAHLIEGGMWVLHPDDEELYLSDEGDLHSHPIGADCARKIGIEYTRQNLIAKKG